MLPHDIPRWRLDPGRAANISWKVFNGRVSRAGLENAPLSSQFTLLPSVVFA